MYVNMAATPKAKFDAAVKVIQSLPKNGSFQPSNELMLKFYAFYKQATLGPCTTAKPSFWDVVGKAKWDAWNKLGSMPREDAMVSYVEELKKIVEAMPHTTMVSDFVQTLGSFYELVDDKMANGVRTSAKGNGFPIHSDPSSGSGSPDGSSESSPSRALPLTYPEEEEEDQLALMASKLPPSSEWEEMETEQAPELSNGNGCHDLVTEEQGADKLEKSPPINSDSEAEDEFCDTLDLPQSPGTEETVHAIVANGVNGVPDNLLQTLSINSTPPSTSSSFSSSSPSPPITSAMLTRGGGETTGSGPRRKPDEGGRDSQQPPQENPPTNPALYPSQETWQRLGGAGGGGQEPNQPPTSSHPQLTEQITLALLRLQQDMNTVLTRLNHLENRLPPPAPYQQQVERWWWPFTGLNGRTVFLLLAWPVFVNVVFSLIRRRRRR